MKTFQGKSIKTDIVFYYDKGNAVKFALLM